MKRLLLLSISSIFCLTISAQTQTWIGLAGGSFNLATNWNPTGVPGLTNDAVIPTGSDILLDGNASIKSFDLQGNAKMTIAANLIVSAASTISANAVITWNAGNLSGNGSITNNGIINMMTSVNKIITDALTLTNNGTFNINTPGDFTLGYGVPTLNNTSSGTINLNAAGKITYQYGVGKLVNSGVIRKAQDNGTYEIFLDFTNNNGTISVEMGTLKLNSSWNSLNGGIYNVPTGNTLELADHLTVSGTLTGQLDGQINWTGIIKVEPAMEAIFNFTGPSGVNWSGGNFGGDGVLTNKGILNLTGVNAKYITGVSTLNNNGMLNVNSAGDFILGFGTPTLNNTDSGTINLNSTGNITYQYGVGTLVNSGVIRKAQDNGVSEILAMFTNNNGTISVEKGTLKLNNNTVSLIGGTYNVTTGNTLEWADHLTVSGTLTGQLDGQINWTGILKVEPATEAFLNFNGPGLNWSGGNFGGDGTLTNKKLLNLTGLTTKYIQGTSILKNNGTINVNSGDIVLGFGTPTLDNSASGVINLISAGSITYAQGIGLLLNSGLIKREGTSGNFAIYANTNNISPGKIICETGILSFGTYTGNGILGGNGSVQLVNNTNFEGTITPGGSPGTLTLVGNYKSSANTILATEIYGPVSGTQYDVFKVQGEVNMNGTIKVDLKYAAILNDEFVILTSNSITSCNLPATVTANYDSHNYTFNVFCNPNNVTLKVASIVLGIEENELSRSLSLYPNPSNGRFTINLGKEYTNVTVQISNTMGQIISSKKYTSSKIIECEINDSHGIHFVKVSTSTGESTTLKLLKQ